MKSKIKEKASTSAEMVAAARAAEMTRPPEERICHDPYARHFLGAKYRFFLKNKLLTSLALWKSEKTDPGAAGCVVSRTRFIDEYLQQCIDEGIKQLVILGAGFDTRAYRFDELKEKVRVFEVDEPITLNVKKLKINDILGALPTHVVYVPVDFEKEGFEKKLFYYGYDKNTKTLFIWEGVTMYITDEAVDKTLSFIVNNSGAGSSVIFNFIHSAVVDGSDRSVNAVKMKKSYEKRGEPMKFGIEKGRAKDFLSERGFHRIKEVDGNYFKDKYFRGNNAERSVCSFCGFVYATVKKSR